MWIEDGEDGSEVRRRRATSAGHGDGQLTHALSGAPRRARVVHLRLATATMRPSLVNTHPFLADGVSLAHNGAIVPTPALAELVGPEAALGLEGNTDSEMYFAVVRQERARGGTLVEAVGRAVRRIRERYPRPSLNAMLLTRDELLVVHSSPAAPVPFEDFEASGLADDLPLNHDEAYFQMSYLRREDGALVFTSAGLDTTGWQPIPQDCVARVDVRTLELTLTPL
jgi:hypothetical protein